MEEAGWARKKNDIPIHRTCHPKVLSSHPPVSLRPVAVDELLTYLDTWSSFEAAKTAPFQSRGLHHFGKFLEPSDEGAGRGCCCFLMRWHSWAFLAHQEWAPEICRAQIWFFSVLTLSMSLRYFSNELYKRGPNTVIAFFWMDCTWFLFVGYWIAQCVPCNLT